MHFCSEALTLVQYNSFSCGFKFYLALKYGSFYDKNCFPPEIEA